MANIAKNGTKHPVSKNPAVAGSQLWPAICPNCTGKIKFPAPKNIPKINDDNKSNCFRLNLFSFIIILP